jgi:hypothetical protein
LDGADLEDLLSLVDNQAFVFPLTDLSFFGCDEKRGGDRQKKNKEKEGEQEMLHHEPFVPPRQGEPGNPSSFPPRDFHSAMIMVRGKGTAMLALFTLPGEEKDSGITVKYSI